jgi:hypothetical protein
MPITVYDKGSWNLSEDILELKSASEVTWDPDLDRRFLIVRRPSHPKENLLLGMDKDLQHFEEGAGDDPVLTLLIVGRQRDRIIGQAETAKLKTSLLREGWKPRCFRCSGRLHLLGEPLGFNFR